MKQIYNCKVALIAILLSMGICFGVIAQTLMPLPPHSSVYSNIYTRGLWFVAPVNFTIVGLKVAPEAGSGLQYIHVMKCTATFPVATSGSTAFTTLSYISGAPNNVVQTVSIPVQQGDQIGIMGTVTGICNSYAASGVVTSTISGQSVYLNRFGYQGSIESGPAPNYWGVANGGSGQIGRIYVYYSVAGATDAGIDSLIIPSDTICSGLNPVQLILKNYGPEPLVSTTINWEVNNAVQTPYAWTGTLPVNGIDTVDIGDYIFHHDTLYDILAFTANPNSFPDTITSNDSIMKSGIFVNELPDIELDSVTSNFCPGDSVLITGTLTGIPPWDLTLNDGTTSFSFTNITNSSFSVYIKPMTTATFTVSSLTDASGCPSESAPTISVTVKPAPPAMISHFGTTACMGDSLMIIANSGANLTYQWYKDGVLLPGMTDYLFMAKQTGAYTVVVTGANGCSTLSDPLNITINPVPIVDLGKDTVMLPNASITLDAGPGYASYQWSNGATTQQIVVDTNGIGIGVKYFWVKVTNNFACEGTDTIRIHFTPYPGIAEAEDITQVNIVPNPSSGSVEIILEHFSPGLIEMELLAVDGKQVLQKTLQMSGDSHSMNLDLNHLPDGLYMLMISSQGNRLAKKLVINR